MKTDSLASSTLRRPIRIQPTTFAVDEGSGQGLIIFETLKSKTKFSVYLGLNTDVGLFVQESFKRKESGFCLVESLLSTMGLKPAKGLIKTMAEEDRKDEILLYFKDNEHGLKKMNLSLLELMGLWSIKGFSLYASRSVIEHCRDVKIQIKDPALPLKLDLHKKYGQKYLM